MRSLKILITFFLPIFLPSLLFSHGINADIITTGVIGVKFSYDGLSPMKNAIVKIYSPDNYDAPSLTSRSNEQGIVFFLPDKKGEWIIMAKDDGGHTTRVNIPVTENMIAKSSGSSLSYLQKIIIAVCVIWGLIGTGLFFSIKRKSGK
jgi:nickel transport protein